MRSDYKQAIYDGSSCVKGLMYHHKDISQAIMSRMELARHGSPTPEGKVIGVAGVALESSTLHGIRVLQGYTNIINASQAGFYDNIRSNVSEVADDIHKDVHSWDSAVDYAKSELGQKHPLYTMLRDIRDTKQRHYDNFVHAWDMKNDVAFENIMKKSKLNPNQFGIDEPGQESN